LLEVKPQIVAEKGPDDPAVRESDYRFFAAARQPLTDGPHPPREVDKAFATRKAEFHRRLPPPLHLLGVAALHFRDRHPFPVTEIRFPQIGIDNRPGPDGYLRRLQGPSERAGEVGDIGFVREERLQSEDRAATVTSKFRVGAPEENTRRATTGLPMPYE
jgi:hypothetical protein